MCSERAGAPDAAVPDTYATHLRTVIARLPAQARERKEIEELFRQLADRLAARHPEIMEIADVQARMEAARRLLFGDMESSPVQPTESAYQFSLHACPPTLLGMEFPDLCCFARTLLDRLVGDEALQMEWIIRGDPRCTFEIRVPDAQTAPGRRVASE